MVDLLLIVPHPDDEVFGCGGMFSRMAQFGRRVATLTLTRGGAGRTLELCERPSLPEMREVELRASLDALGVKDVHIFDYPDFVTASDRGMPENLGLAGIDPDEIVPRIAKLLDELEPRTVVTFPPNGSNGHPDHVTTHQLVRQALECARHRVSSIYYFASERAFAGEARPGFLDPAEIARLHLPPTHYIDVHDFVENKLRAMGQHQTQALSVMNFLRRFPRRITTESFHRAYPEVPPGDGPRTVLWLD